MSRVRPSRRTLLALIAAAALSLVASLLLDPFRSVRPNVGDGWHADGSVSLPEPREQSDASVEEAIADRRSRRDYDDRALERRELGQLLWATQGVTHPAGYRASPSAGALYPLEVYVVVGSPGVEGLEAGVFRYRPDRHALARGRTGDLRSELRAAALDQESVEEAPVDVVVCAVAERTTRKYGERGRERYVPMEAGHAGENLYLQAEALGLATVSIGAFRDHRVRDVVEAPADQRPLYVFPVGARP